MRKRLIALAIAVVLAGAAYFTKSWWMDFVVPNQDVLVETGNIETGQKNTITGAIPRIMFWYGKVNQHINLQTSMRETDPDGIAGAGTYSEFGNDEGWIDRKLEYCKRFYPNTTSVREYKMEETNTRRGRYNLGGPNTSIKQSYECVQVSNDSGDLKEPENTSIDIGISDSLDNSNKRYHMGLLNDWQETYDFYCMLPPISKCDESDGCQNTIPLWDTNAKIVNGKVKCSNDSLLGFTLTKKDLTGYNFGTNRYTVALDNFDINGLEHPRDCFEVCPLVIYGKDDYLIKETGRGDSDCGFDEETWYNKKYSTQEFQLSQGGCTGPHEFIIKKGNMKIEIAPILSDEKNVVDDAQGIECREYSFEGFSLKKNGETIENFTISEEKICFSFGESVGAHGEFNTDTNKIEVSMDRLGIFLNIDVVTLNYTVNK